MFLIKDTLVSTDLIERFFKCDLAVCKGECCIDGDAGAPLLESEKNEIEKHLHEIMPLLSENGRQVIKERGVSYTDQEGDLVTMLINGCACAFTEIDKDGVCLCALEKGWREKKLPQLKPSSCHLYPVRLSKCGSFTAVNLHRWKICKCAEILGRKENIRAYQFLKEPLIRKFGEEWYAELELTAEEYLKQNSKTK